MRQATRRCEGQVVCLGLVIVAQPGRLSEVTAALAADDRFDVGPGEGHRLPVSVITDVGSDQQLLREIESLPSVLVAEVVYAQTLEQEDMP